MLSKHDSTDTVMHQNKLIAYAYSQYLNHTPRFLDSGMVQSLAKDCGIEPTEAFLVLFSAACGLDTAENADHRMLERNYIRAGVQKLDAAKYREDPYYRTIRFPNQKMGKWEMKQEFYAPYEPFVFNHPILTSALREIPQIGYFTEEFHFPAILENGVEWMTVTPNEIETMRLPIQKSCGRVLTLGLGLGYFAFCASLRAEVSSVTVIERDRDVIALMQKELLPQFPSAEKIDIIEADAFDWMQKNDIGTRFDYVFADLWHDPSDGLDLYLQLRRIEREKNIPNIDYWIEPSLLSALRHMVYEKLKEGAAPLHLQAPIKELLEDEFLHRLAPDLKRLN